MKAWLFVVAFAAGLASLATAHAQLVDAARFVDPISAWSAELSPDGQYVAYIERTDEDERVVVFDIARETQRIVQRVGRDRGSLDWVMWKTNNRLVAGLQISVGMRERAPTGSRVGGGGETSFNIQRVVAFDRDGANLTMMFEGQRNQIYGGRGSAFLLDVLSNEPDHILLQAWDNLGTGVWRADIRTGRAERMADGAWETAYYVTDGEGYPVLRVDGIADGSGYRIFRRATDTRDWTFVLEARRTAVATNSPDFRPVASGPGPSEVYVLARLEGEDLASLYLYNAETGEFGVPLQTPENADASMPWINPETGGIVATCEFAQRRICAARERSVQRHLNALNSFFGNNANVSLASMSQSGEVWLLAVDGPLDPGAYFLYDTRAASVRPVVAIYPQLDRTALTPTEVIPYRSRDGVNLWGYLTRSPSALGSQPLVVMPHGGPEARDYYGYDAYVQFLASRGYAVFQPNFRGSLGFGREFGDAGRGQWGLRMQDDVTDGVQHLISAGIADRERICIVGASYGGYAALAGATLTPDLYRCVVSIAGVSDLTAMLRTERGGSIQNYQYWLRSIGNPNTLRDQLEATSPRRQVSHVNVPVLLMHGEADEVVLIRQSEMMERELREAGKSVRLVRFEGEGHIWDAWERANRLTLFRETESFLAEHLRGTP